METRRDVGPGEPAGYKRASRKGAPRRFSCEFPGCDKMYSRSEHLQRHQLNHEPKEIFSCDVAGCDQKFVRADLLARHKKRHSTSYVPRNRPPSFATETRSAAIQQTPRAPAWPATVLGGMKPGFAENTLVFGVQPTDMGRTETFGMWLFDPINIEFSMAQLPFSDDGLESTFNSNIHYDESLTSSRSPPQLAENDELLRDYRRDVVLQCLERFRLYGELPRPPSLDSMRDCIREYWQRVAPRLPIVHQPTFDCNRGSILLLMVMIALGGASLRGHDTTGQYSECGVLAEVIIEGVRWEILTQDDASPPVSLSAAQSLLLLEFYEKMYSSRKLHERAHIYHTATLTLLRRGSPLIGRSGAESPPEQQPAADARTQWIQWADTEAMQRVVFAAFMMDVLHAAMFGHAADMAPHEIRLPLPCDDTLWSAPTPELARQHESNLRMYGIAGLPFLDGLKKALHGKSVRTASFGRMIIMSGLLSVGWHLSHRETHLKSLDLTAPSTQSQESWKRIVLKAFDSWKDDIDAVQAGEADDGRTTGLNGPVQNAAVLYHLAHICLHVDIVDCQVYAGAQRVLGRKVSARDRANAVSRMEGWSRLPRTRHAVLHAFRLLRRALVDPRFSERTYSCRDEPDPHRPWIMYYAALCIWSYVMALRKTRDAPAPGHWAPRPPAYGRVVAYLTNVSSLADLKESDAGMLADGLPDLLDTLHAILAEAHWELLQEAQVRLKACKEILLGG